MEQSGIVIYFSGSDSENATQNIYILLITDILSREQQKFLIYRCNYDR